MKTASRPDTVAKKTEGRVGPEWAVLAGVLVVFAVATVRILAVDAPLGHDESVYASWGRHWLEGTPNTGWADHRAPGVTALGTVVQLFTASEAALRSIGLLFGVVLVGGAWWLARSITDPGLRAAQRTAGPSAALLAGAVAAATIATAPPLHEAAALFLTDLPAAALMVAGAAVLWRELELRHVPTYRLVAVAPLLAGGFYARYGAAPFVALLFLTAAALWWRTIVARPGPPLVTAGAFVVVLVPHLVNAHLDLGAPWARVLYTAGLGARAGDGPIAEVRTYLGWFPSELAGPVAGAVMIVGVAAAVAGVTVAAARGRFGRPERAWVLLVAPAVGAGLLVAARSEADQRFMFPTVAFLVVAGAVAVGRAATAARARLGVAGPSVATVALAVFALAFLAVMAGSHRWVVEEREDTALANEPVRAAAQEIRTRSVGDCVIATSYSPQTTWYAACESYFFRLLAPEELAAFDGDRWVLLFDGGKNQPEGADRDAYLALTPGEPDFRIDAPGPLIRGAEAYRVTR